MESHPPPDCRPVPPRVVPRKPSAVPARRRNRGVRLFSTEECAPRALRPPNDGDGPLAARPPAPRAVCRLRETVRAARDETAAEFPSALSPSPEVRQPCVVLDTCSLYQLSAQQLDELINKCVIYIPFVVKNEVGRKFYFKTRIPQFQLLHDCLNGRRSHPNIVVMEKLPLEYVFSSNASGNDDLIILSALQLQSNPRHSVVVLSEDLFLLLKALNERIVACKLLKYFSNRMTIPGY